VAQAANAFNCNIHALRLLLKETRKRLSRENGTSRAQFSPHYIALEGVVNDVIEEFLSFLQYLESLKMRLERITEAIRDSIALRSTYHAAVENQNMKLLALKSVKEARTVKAIALVTLVYLPATFVAVRTLLSQSIYRRQRADCTQDIPRNKRHRHLPLQDWGPSDRSKSPSWTVFCAHCSADCSNIAAMVGLGKMESIEDKQAGSADCRHGNAEWFTGVRYPLDLLTKQHLEFIVCVSIIVCFIPLRIVEFRVIFSSRIQKASRI
jgi:hypothetical protein